MKENYMYPARFEEVDGEIEVSFLDFPTVKSYGSDMEEAVSSAQEALALVILDYESQNKELPEASKCTSEAVYVHIWLPYFRNKSKEIYIRKSVTIPQWLDLLAKENEINFSAALVKGIKMELGIHD